jgi:hypothetical protein
MYHLIEKRYNAALTSRSGERSATLDQADPEVRREVESHVSGVDDRAAPKTTRFA